MTIYDGCATAGQDKFVLTRNEQKGVHVQVHVHNNVHDNVAVDEYALVDVDGLSR